MNTAQFVLDHAEAKPKEVQEILIGLHQKGETVADILEFVTELDKRKVKVISPLQRTFDVCGTGGSGKSRINLSTVLAIKLSAQFGIAKHGNKAASGRVGSFDLIEAEQYAIGDTPEKVVNQLESKNLSFVFAPAFHPALKPMAPIRKNIPHPTIFNYLGPILNPVENLTAQMTGVSNIEVGEKLAEVCAKLGKNILLVHDTHFGLDDVSIGGKTRFWRVIENRIEAGQFIPEDYGFESLQKFSDISGGALADNKTIFENLLKGSAPNAHQEFLAINQKVAEEFLKNSKNLSRISFEL